MDLDSFLVSSYVLVDDRWQAGHAHEPRRPGLVRPCSRTLRSSPRLSWRSGRASAARGISGASLERTCTSTSRRALLPGPVRLQARSPREPESRARWPRSQRILAPSKSTPRSAGLFVTRWTCRSNSLHVNRLRARLWPSVCAANRFAWSCNGCSVPSYRVDFCARPATSPLLGLQLFAHQSERGFEVRLRSGARHV